MTSTPRKPEFDVSVAEMSLIGHLMMYPARLYQCQVIRAAHFATQRHAEVWTVVRSEIEKRGTGVAPAQICDLLARAGVMGKAEAASFLIECKDHALNAPDPEAAGTTFASQLIDAGYRRNLLRTAADLQALSREAVDTDEIRQDANARVYDMLNYEMLGQQDPLDQRIYKIIQEAKADPKPEDKGPRGLQTGIAKIDDIYHGAKPGQLIVIMARPSVGKSALGTQFATNWCRKGAHGVLWSLEMSGEDLCVRMACQMSGLDSYDVERRTLSAADRRAYIQAMEELHSWTTDADRKFWVEDSSRMDGRVMPKSVQDVITEAMHWRNRMKLDFLMVDYLQLLTGRRLRGENREREVAGISVSLKQLAQQLRVPVIALCQARRPDRDHVHKRPRMSDARESGAIEQDADAFFIIHNPSFARGFEDEQEESSNEPRKRAIREPAEIILEKQRNGPTGLVKVDFVTSCGRFEERMGGTIYGGGNAYSGNADAPWENG